MQSIRSTFSGPDRDEELFVGSVKDNIGHAEAASGAAGVIKTLLMIQHGLIPKQANFVKLNPQIKLSASDRISVPKVTQPWDTSRRVALVNNYGAAGNNAAIVIREHDEASKSRQMSNGVHFQSSSNTFPILLSARSPSSLRMYASALKPYVPSDGKLLSSFVHHLFQRQNPSFEYRAAFDINNPKDLLAKLDETGAESSFVAKCPGEYPVVLCFGGQTGGSINLSRELFEGSVLLRKYLVS
jgi:acyl transferase domain-containing protein